jgi:hypothetical protein
LLETPLSQGDRGKETTLEKSIDYTEEELTDEQIFSSPNPIQTIKKLLRKSNIELASLIEIQPQTQEIKERIKALMKKIKIWGKKDIYLSHLFILDFNFYTLTSPL